MTTPLKCYGCEGPLGFPMLDKQAHELEALLKSLPKSKEFEYKKSISIKGPTELNPGERSDVSWISTETMDLLGDVVFAKGMDDSKFSLNPIVTYAHNYFSPPVGRSLWRKRVKDGDLVGIKAKTQYPPMPESWNNQEVWQPDQIFSQIQAGLLNGKSIGWLPLKTHFADVKEANKLDCHEGSLIIEEWLLLEYAVCALPMNPEAITEETSKSVVKTQGQEIMDALYKAVTYTPTTGSQESTVIKHTSLEEIQRSLEERMRSIDLKTIIQSIYDQKRGRV